MSAIDNNENTIVPTKFKEFYNNAFQDIIETYIRMQADENMCLRLYNLMQSKDSGKLNLMEFIQIEINNHHKIKNQS